MKFRIYLNELEGSIVDSCIIEANNNIEALFSAEKVFHNKRPNAQIVDAGMFVDPNVSSRDMVLLEDNEECAYTIDIVEVIK